MADNYLENKMEEYRRGAVRRVAAYWPTTQAPGTALFNFKPFSAAIFCHAGGDTVLEAVAVTLRRAGCKVALVCPDIDYGRRLSQQNSLVFVPGTTLPRNCPPPQVRVSYAEAALIVETPEGEHEIIAGTATPEAVARTVLYIMLPMSRHLALPHTISAEWM